MTPPIQMKLTALQEVPSRTGGLPMFRLTGTVDNTLQVFMVPFAAGAELRESVREIYGFKQMFAPPASLELQGRWRGDTKSIFDATSIKVDRSLLNERAPELKSPKADRGAMAV